MEGRLPVMIEILTFLLALVVGLLSSARLTRLITQDSFPPSAWFRAKWDKLTDDGDWSILMHCHWCLAPWVVIPIGLWAWLTDFHVSWWVFNGWLAASYIAAGIVERDEVAQ